ncbi:hypothetical protein SacmaDRAFT_0491 [Saccharomonospora marina XMU15]|uniref:Transcription factor zinc-finger domain-containing protein n=1 Tax=Saccharomonospora marina XMU15 TaxID=882083 RepID=H5X3C3_9PSEU|nr:zf-TFIIB domain-containing protein [Saccharomonospora marina]EHR48792.1 hypothetical protein SacmaDRAFT_0491 [Saccharomonospora marina XMU15]
MICPKCQNVMKTVNKAGIHIEQCEGCRGIFLDHGELEQVVNAENAYYGAPAAPAPPYRPAGGPQPPVPPPPPMHHGGYRDSPAPYRGGGYYKDSPKPYRGGYGDSPKPYGHGYGHRRKRSFLENLFD